MVKILTGSTHRVLAKSAGIIGALTGVSRVLGFIRDLVIATAFGTGVSAEAFVVSFKIPNLLRDLVGEGAANSAFVPVLTECYEKKKVGILGVGLDTFYPDGHDPHHAFGVGEYFQSPDRRPHRARFYPLPRP